MIYFMPHGPSFTFSINTGVKKIKVYQYKLQRKDCSWHFIINSLNPPDKDYFKPTDTFTKLGERFVSFDYIEIKESDYTNYNLCITIWGNNGNPLHNDLNFLAINDLPKLLDETGIQLTDKQISTLKRMFKAYSKKWKFPPFKF